MLSKYHNQAQYQLSLKMNKEKAGRRRVRNLLPYEEACGSLPLSPVFLMSQPNRKSTWFTYGRHAFITFFVNLYELRHWHKHIHSFPSQTPHVCRSREWKPASVGIPQRNQAWQLYRLSAPESTASIRLYPLEVGMFLGVKN